MKISQSIDQCLTEIKGIDMLLRDPCKKCIVRACCQIACHVKTEQVNTINSITYYIESVVNCFLWCKRNLANVLFILIPCSIVSGEIIVLIWLYFR